MVAKTLGHSIFTLHPVQILYPTEVAWSSAGYTYQVRSVSIASFINECHNNAKAA